MRILKCFYFLRFSFRINTDRRTIFGLIFCHIFDLIMFRIEKLLYWCNFYFGFRFSDWCSSRLYNLNVDFSGMCLLDKENKFPNNFGLAKRISALPLSCFPHRTDTKLLYIKKYILSC